MGAGAAWNSSRVVKITMAVIVAVAEAGTGASTVRDARASVLKLALLLLGLLELLG